MFTNINQGYAIATQIEVSPTNDLPLLDKPATYYDYFALMPALITATTPLILGVLRKNDHDEKSDS